MSSAVANFIQTCIQSVWQLELLLYMKASGKTLTPSEVAHTLYMTPEVIASGLEHFEKCGLVKTPSPGSFIYAPSTSELDRVVDETAKSYSSRRVAVVNMIFSQSIGTKTTD